MAELLGVMFCYLFIILQNKQRLQECIIFILFTIQCALSYCLSYLTVIDILLWLVTTAVIDIIVSLLIGFTYPSKGMITLVILTVLGLLCNIISYININYYSYSLNLFITDHYTQCLLLLVPIDRKYLNTSVKILLLGTILL